MIFSNLLALLLLEHAFFQAATKKGKSLKTRSQPRRQKLVCDLGQPGMSNDYTARYTGHRSLESIEQYNKHTHSH